MKKHTFVLGLLTGVVIVVIITIITELVFAIQDPLYGQHPNAILNDPEYTIDTIITTSRHNTVVEYKFVKVEE